MSNNIIPLADVAYPVYRLRKEKPIVENNRTFYKDEFLNLDTEELTNRILVVDDTNIEGARLGIRRIKLAKDKSIKLFHIASAIYTLSDVIKLSASGYWFIDTNGKLFYYKRSTKAILICAKIGALLPVENGVGCVVIVQGIHIRFKVMYRPPPYSAYVGLLKFAGGYLLYGFYEKPFKETWRKI